MLKPPTIRWYIPVWSHVWESKEFYGQINMLKLYWKMGWYRDSSSWIEDTSNCSLVSNKNPTVVRVIYQLTYLGAPGGVFLGVAYYEDYLGCYVARSVPASTWVCIPLSKWFKIYNPYITLYNPYVPYNPIHKWGYSTCIYIFFFYLR
mgnify:CR=1 FL=1